MAKRRKVSVYFLQSDWDMWAGRMRLGDAVVVGSYAHARCLTTALRRALKRVEIWKERAVEGAQPSWRLTCVTGEVARKVTRNTIPVSPICDRCLHGNHGGCERGQVFGKRAPVECACPHPEKVLAVLEPYKRQKEGVKRVERHAQRPVVEPVKVGWISRAAADRLNREIAEWRRAAEAQQAGDGAPSAGAPSTGDSTPSK